MPIATSLTRLLDLDAPIMQAPIGSCSGPELCAAVSNGGGLGSMALSWDTLESCRDKIHRTLALTRRPFAVNLVIEWDQTERLETCLAAGAKIVSLFWGTPKPYLPRIHAAGARAIVAVGSGDEARAFVDLGADIVLCQGVEAGGHVWGKTGSISLVPPVVDAAGSVPVIAAGGFADGRGLLAALALGASGISMGTRFVATEESRAHQAFKERIVAAAAEDAVYTTLFDGGWPDAPHRVLRNSTIEKWEAAGRPASGSRPGEGDVIGTLPGGKAIHRYDDMPPVRGMDGDWEACALYAGQSVGVVRAIRPAAELIREIVAEAERAADSISRSVRL